MWLLSKFPLIWANLGLDQTEVKCLQCNLSYAEQPRLIMPHRQADAVSSAPSVAQSR